MKRRGREGDPLLDRRGAFEGTVGGGPCRSRTPRNPYIPRPLREGYSDAGIEMMNDTRDVTNPAVAPCFRGVLGAFLAVDYRLKKIVPGCVRS
jgi:hypothetical protein